MSINSYDKLHGKMNSLAGSFLFSIALLGGCASLPEREPPPGTYPGQEHEKEDEDGNNLHSGLVMKAQVQSDVLGSLSAKHAFFSEKLGIPKNLISFLMTNKVEVNITEDYTVPLDFCESVSMDVAGKYDPSVNTITLPNHYSDWALFHEIGHGLWDEDGIFSIKFSDSYSGPSREDFKFALSKISEYERQEDIILSQSARTAYCKLIGKLKGEEKGKIKEFYAQLNKSNPKECAYFLNYALDGILKEEEIGLEKKILNEVFAESFSYWMAGRETPLASMFEAMRYNGKSLKQ